MATVDVPERSPTAGEPRAKPLWRRVAGAVVSLVVVLLIFGKLIPQFADYQQVWAALQKITAPQALLLVLVTAFNVVTYVWLLQATLPEIRFAPCFVAMEASSAVSNAVPAGGAVAVGVTWDMYRSWGIGTGAFARSTVLSGIWNNFVKLGLPIVAVAIVAVAGETDPRVVAAAVLGLAVLAVAIVVFTCIVRSDRFARRIGSVAQRIVSAALRPLHRGPVEGWDDALLSFRVDSAALIGSRWARITAAAIVSQLAVFLVLLTSLRVVGVPASVVGWPWALLSFCIMRLATAIPITPGGLGVTQAVLIPMLSLGVDASAQTAVVAAVMLYTVLTYLIQFPLGAGAYLFWRRNTSWRAPRTGALTALGAGAVAAGAS